MDTPPLSKELSKMSKFGLGYPLTGISQLYANHLPPLPGFLPRIFGPIKLTPEIIERLAERNASFKTAQQEEASTIVTTLEDCTPVTSTPVDSSSAAATPLDSSVASTLVDSSSVASTPIDSSSVAATPLDSSVASTPVDSSSVAPTPVDSLEASTPVDSSSVASTPGDSSSVASTPVDASSVASTPVAPSGDTPEVDEVFKESEAQRELRELTAQVEFLEEEVDKAERLFRFTTRMTKKLVLLNQLADVERQKAIQLGIPAGDNCPWLGKILKSDASTSMDALNRPGAIPAPSTRTVGVTAESVTVLHHCTGFDTVESESCVIGVKGNVIPTLDDSVSDIVAHGKEPRVSDIAVHLDETPSHKTLKEYAERIGRLSRVVEASTCMLQVALGKMMGVRPKSEASVDADPDTSHDQSTSTELSQLGH